jgi:(p)ppGpp synthase/HD superfamily hydrolase
MSFTRSDKAKLHVRSYLEGRKFFRALEAMELCLKYHNGLRKDGVTPEWFHQFSIVMYLMTLEDALVTLDSDAEAFYIVAFLHDIVEDYDYPLETVAEKFGGHIAKAVELISKKYGYRKTNSDYYKAMSINFLASVVKGADRIHNFQTMIGVFTHEKQESYMDDCRENILPMLKLARKAFPILRPVYENLKHMLTMQMMLIEEVRGEFNPPEVANQ